MKQLTDHLEGKSSAVRLVAAVVLVWPLYLVRFTLIGVVAGLWVWHAPQVAIRVWSTVVRLESTNERRTPKKSRPWQRLDNFADVRARIREQR